MARFAVLGITSDLALLRSKKDLTRPDVADQLAQLAELKEDSSHRDQVGDLDPPVQRMGSGIKRKPIIDISLSFSKCCGP